MTLHAYRTARHAHTVISILGIRSAGWAIQLFFATNSQPAHNHTGIGLTAVRLEVGGWLGHSNKQRHTPPRLAVIQTEKRGTNAAFF